MSNINKTAIDTRFQNLIESQTSTPVSSSNEQLSLLAYGAFRANTELTASTNFNGLPILSETPIANGQILYVTEVSAPITVADGCFIGLDSRPLSITKVNAIYGWGFNCCGAAGTGSPAPVPFNTREASCSTNWCSVSAGSNHTVGLKADGSLWSWGMNNCGQIGTGGYVCVSTPVREITSSTNWCRVSAGYQHTSAIKTDGSLWVWGDNICGQLGDGSVVSRITPIREGTFTNSWCFVSSGCNYTAAIKTDGSLWMWGSNFCGKLGINTTTPSSNPVRETTSSSNWCQVSLGVFHTAAIKTDGSLWSWGINSCGQLALNNTTPAAVSVPRREICSDSTWCCVSAGGDSTAAIKTNGTLWAWGDNSHSALGSGSSTCLLAPTREYSPLLTSWKSVSMGKYKMFATTNTGDLYGVGASLQGSSINNDGSTNFAASASLLPIKYYTGWTCVSAAGHSAIDQNAAGIIAGSRIPGR